MTTCDLVAIPLGRASTGKAPTDGNAPDLEKLQKEIDVFSCLSLIHAIALYSAESEEAPTALWSSIKFDFILLMLMKAQPLPQILLMLQLLDTSIFDKTFGAILDDFDGGRERQDKSEAELVDRLLNLLFEKPSCPVEGHECSSVDIATLRLQVLHLFRSISATQHGGQTLARHRYAVGRLIKFLHDSIDALYAYRPATHELTTSAVNLSLRLIYHIVTAYPEIVDVRAKLSVVHGGAHKHLIALTRLAFSDQLVLEEGVENEVVDAAHQLLEEYLSPGEGEALLQVFSSVNTEGQEGGEEQPVEVT
ncbi:hypothetical protein LTS18_004445 [Coniosporium uncinatum]|uniref:Uncharacterized protein n=1 Tax=Coniosporium uncinatum TaxID=93489 RepID=A0ACC3D5P3_9PEZI|nr:hypothetical protein LTS18_004445 [Coniosporium uncinatum]